MIHGNGDFKTKKSLKDAVKGGEVVSLERYFSDPSMFGAKSMDNLQGEAVVGPSAYERKWYAQVWTNEHGIVTKVT